MASSLAINRFGCAISLFKSSGSSSNNAAGIGPESMGIVVCRSVGTVPGIVGLLWPSFRPKPGSESKTP